MMDKKLVLAALFSTSYATDCDDYQVQIEKKKKAALVAELGTITTALAGAGVGSTSDKAAKVAAWGLVKFNWPYTVDSVEELPFNADDTPTLDGTAHNTVTVAGRKNGYVPDADGVESARNPYLLNYQIAKRAYDVADAASVITVLTDSAVDQANAVTPADYDSARLLLNNAEKLLGRLTAVEKALGDEVTALKEERKLYNKTAAISGAAEGAASGNNLLILGDATTTHDYKLALLPKYRALYASVDAKAGLCCDTSANASNGWYKDFETQRDVRWKMLGATTDAQKGDLGWVDASSKKWDPTSGTKGALNWGQFWDDAGMAGAAIAHGATNFNFLAKNSNAVTWLKLTTNAAYTEGTFEDFVTKAKEGEAKQLLIDGFWGASGAGLNTTDAAGYTAKLDAVKVAYRNYMLKQLKWQMLKAMAQGYDAAGTATWDIFDLGATFTTSKVPLATDSHASEIAALQLEVGQKRTNTWAGSTQSNGTLLQKALDDVEDILIGHPGPAFAHTDAYVADTTATVLSKLVKAYADKEVLMGATVGRASKLALDSKQALVIRKIMVKLQAIKAFEADYTTKQAAIDAEIAAIGVGYVAPVFHATNGTIATPATAATAGQLFAVAKQRLGLEAIIEGLQMDLRVSAAALAAERTARYNAYDAEIVNAENKAYYDEVKVRALAYKDQWGTIKSQTATRLVIFQEKFNPEWKAYRDAVKANKKYVDRKAALGADDANTAACTSGATGLIKGAYTAICAAEKKCRAHEYAVAHKLKKEITTKAASDTTLSGTLKSAYDTAHPAAAAGKADGNRCEKLAGATYDDGDKDRVACAEGLCCGSADKFLRDGSKMTIETCQKKEATTYTYWPPFVTGMLANPKSETWRFQCISAASELIVSATAAFYAIYMMQ